MCCASSLREHKHVTSASAVPQQPWTGQYGLPCRRKPAAAPDPREEEQVPCGQQTAKDRPAMDFIQAGGHRLEYRWIKPHATVAKALPALVFLHEGLGSVALWKRFPDLVTEATGCSALVYSRYGYGKSDRLREPRAVDYMHREALKVLPELLDALSISDPVLIGHSDGAS